MTPIRTRQSPNCLAIAFAIAVLVTALPAEAAHKIYLSDGVDSILIEDQDFGPDAPNTGADIYPEEGVVT